MTTSNETPKPGSKSETASAMRDALGSAAGKVVGAAAITRDMFSANAAVATMYEIVAAKIAVQRSRREGVKQFARQIIAEHDKANSELRSFLGAANSPQSPPDSLDALHQTLIDDLNGASDEHFDGRYIAQQRSALSAAVTLFNTYHQAGRDDGVRNLAGLALPALEHQVEMLSKLETS